MRSEKTAHAIVGWATVVGGVLIWLSWPSSEPQLSPEEAAAAAEREAVACREDLQCWGDEHIGEASIACRPHIERLAQYDFEWTDGWLGLKFSRFMRGSTTDKSLIYVGDQVRFQNGLGGWVRHRYSCAFDPERDEVLSVEASPGRLR